MLFAASSAKFLLKARSTFGGQAMRRKIAVLIPAYNEAKNIESVLQELFKLRDSRPEWQILPIVVNDGSSDQTEIILKRITRHYGAYAIHFPLNLGIGCAIRTGLKHAATWGADIALQLDGDGQHPANQIPALVSPILEGRCNVAVGSRYIEGAGGNVSSIARQIGTHFFSRLIKLLVGFEIKDTTSGFRAFDRKTIEYLARCYPDDYPEVEAYVLLARQHFSILEVPVQMRPRTRGTSSITPFRCAYYMTKVAFAAWISLVRELPIAVESHQESEIG
jgi:glycosyltransferase involved in cell wall biosynthesis